MDRYLRSHLADSTLLSHAGEHASRERESTAELLADLAEIESRSLHLELGYGSMFAYCVGALRLSEASALRRIKVARVARQFPSIFERIADGRLTLTSVLVLAPRLTNGPADELLVAAEGKSKLEIERMLAALAFMPARDTESSRRLAPERVECARNAAEHPVAPDTWELRVRYGDSTHGKLGYLRELLSHQIPSGDLAEVLDRALDLAIGQAEKQKFASTDRPRSPEDAAAPGGGVEGSRHIPAHVKQAVWKRDDGRCAYVSPDGRRCDSRWQVEFDHREPFARGGEATVGNVRLLCRAHNQYLAERTYGADFMSGKRSKLHGSRVNDDLLPWLRRLGFSVAEARDRAALADNAPDATLEARMRIALSGRVPGRERTTAA